MEKNENTGSIPQKPETAGMPSDDMGPGATPAEQPTTVAGGGLGPLETAIENEDRDDS